MIPEVVDRSADLAVAEGFGGGGAGGEGARASQTRAPSRLPRAVDPKRDGKDHGRKFRRAAGISAYVGANGSGKSAAMVFDTLPTLDGMKWRCSEPSHRHMQPDYVDLETGELGPTTIGFRRVLSTVALLDSTTGELHPRYDELSSRSGGWPLVINAEHTDILFDEVTGIAGSREAMGMPVAVQNVLQQLRRRDVLLRWSAPAWSRADSIIRSVSQHVTLCRGFFPDYRSQRRSDEPKAWVPKRLFKWRTFDARNFEEFTMNMASADRKDGSKIGRLRAKPVAWVWGPGSRMFASYDTYGEVKRIAEYLDGGRCAHCGGRRAVPVCKCEG